MTPARATTPPRTAELLLETLGADVALRDAVMGDLAEEYASLADAVDARAARRWYWREALRATPHLLASAIRLGTWDSVRRRAGIALSAYVLALVISVVISVCINVVAARALGTEGLARGEALSALLGLQLLVASSTSLLAGYVAAWLDDRAPLVSALTLAALWALWYLAMGIVSDSPVMLVRQVALGVIAMAGMTTGGVLRLRQLAHRPRSGGRSTA